MEISLNRFTQLVNSCREMNVQFVSLQELSNLLSRKEKLKRPVIHFSFDDGLLDNYQLAFPYLNDQKIPFSVFVSPGLIKGTYPVWWYIIEELARTGAMVEFDKYQFSVDCKALGAEASYGKLLNFVLQHIDENPAYFNDVLNNYTIQYGLKKFEMLNFQQLHEMLSSGLCEIGSHTEMHTRMANRGYTDRREIIQSGIDSLAKELNTPISFFAYPYGGYNDIGDHSRDAEIFKESGIKMALSAEVDHLTVHSNPFLIPRVTFNEQTTHYMLKTMLNGCYQSEVF